MTPLTQSQNVSVGRSWQVLAGPYLKSSKAFQYTENKFWLLALSCVQGLTGPTAHISFLRLHHFFPFYTPRSFLPPRIISVKFLFLGKSALAFFARLVPPCPSRVNLITDEEACGHTAYAKVASSSVYTRVFWSVPSIPLVVAPSQLVVNFLKKNHLTD